MNNLSYIYIHTHFISLSLSLSLRHIVLSLNLSFSVRHSHPLSFQTSLSSFNTSFPLSSMFSSLLANCLTFVRFNMSQSQPLFCLFASFSYTNYNFSTANWKKCRWCAWYLNPGPQMVDADVTTKVWVLSNMLVYFPYNYFILLLTSTFTFSFSKTSCNAFKIFNTNPNSHHLTKVRKKIDVFYCYLV